MGCGEKNHKSNCICDILKKIVDAQNDIVENCCETSCDQSINDLLGDTDTGNGLDTVPVILYCADGCKPFKGFGAHAHKIEHIKSSFFFRVKKVTKDCCAVVELLRDPHCDKSNPSDPTEQKTKHLQATGICMTVDVNCFCHITCLPAISAF